VKKKRNIVIKDPTLKRLRNNLRMILRKWASAQWNKLHEEQDKILLDESKFETFRNLERKKQEIRKIVEDSICECSLCSAPDKDMTYNPVRKEWYCVDCYKDLQDYYKNKKESVLFP